MEKDFLAIVQLVKAFNTLHKGISDEPRFVVEIRDRSCFVYGLGVDLALIYSILWAQTLCFNLYIGRNDKGQFVEFNHM